MGYSPFVLRDILGRVSDASPFGSIVSEAVHMVPAEFNSYRISVEERRYSSGKCGSAKFGLCLLRTLKGHGVR
ncbi:MAG: hypothetical protein K8R64_03035 [Methanosarcinaceae archaeon]|nr:hypothetical protein [Methanosarcinaceae archaeon]